MIIAIFSLAVAYHQTKKFDNKFSNVIFNPRATLILIGKSRASVQVSQTLKNSSYNYYSYKRYCCYCRTTTDVATSAAVNCNLNTNTTVATLVAISRQFAIAQCCVCSCVIPTAARSQQLTNR